MSGSLLTRYWKAQDPYDPDVLAQCRHPEWSAEWPQTGERITNHENDVLINTNYPDYPHHELGRAAGRESHWGLSPLGMPVKLHGSGNLWIAEARLSYPDQGVFHAAFILELKDGLIFRETGYFARHSDPPEWRTDLVERIPQDGSGDPSGVTIRTLEPSGEEPAHREALEAYFEAPRAGSNADERRALYLSGMRALFHPDAVEDLVQFGERVRGLDNMLALVERHPDFPSTVDVRRIIGSGDLFVVEARLVYEQGTFWEAEVLEFRGDKVAKATEYFAEESEAPDWRRQWVEPM